MIQLHVLSGAAAGKRFESKTFPVTIGRGAANALTLSDPGVFERHLEIRFSGEGFSFISAPDAVVTLNGCRAEGGTLRNGDLLGAGYTKLQFWLAALPQRGLRLREVITWLLVSGVAGAQIFLLLRLLEMAR